MKRLLVLAFITSVTIVAYQKIYPTAPAEKTPVVVKATPKPRPSSRAVSISRINTDGSETKLWDKK